MLTLHTMAFLLYRILVGCLCNLMFVQFSAQKAADNAKNVKRESKAYSYKEQKLDMELREVSNLVI